MQESYLPTLQGRRVLLTGGSSGIGRALAEALLQEQADVGIVSRRQPAAWEGGPPSDRAGRWSVIPGDLNAAQALSEACEHWLQPRGEGLDLLIHCAVSYGSGARHTFLETEPAEWEEIIRVNLNGPALLTRALLPALLRRPESLIIYLSSEVAFNPGPKRVGYSTAKAAAHAMFKGIAEELRETAVRIVGMAPEGMVDTPGIRRRRPPDFDYSGYAPAASFAPAIRMLARSLGAQDHGEMLVVGADGSYRRLGSGSLASQSR